MEEMMQNAYKGDPGVPHGDPEWFIKMWKFSLIFSSVSWVGPSILQLPSKFNNWQDKAMKHEQQHWKKAMGKREPQLKKNQKGEAYSESSNDNGPIFLP